MMKALAGLVLALAILGCRTPPPTPAPPERPPNVVLIAPDDLGYGDIGAFGGADVRTPHLDRMAREGVRLTSFYAAQPDCTASRAALLTGSYSNRVGLIGSLGPNSPIGIHPDEQTLGELLRAAGYATGAFGTWHLGDAPEFSPLRHGFDVFAGLPYSNDLWPPNGGRWPPLPFIDGDQVARDGDHWARVLSAGVTEVTADTQAKFTQMLTARAVSFIETHRDRPFFLYVPHPMPHVPIFASSAFAGRSARGLYGDVIEELDWSVGQILAALDRNGLNERTLVIFLSGNGPSIVYGDHGGSTGGLRGGKHTTFEGGVRVPFIARWPGRIPAGSSSGVPVMNIDLLPTIAKLAGSSLPAGRTIDGRDIWPWVAGLADAPDPHEALFFYDGRQLHAVRSGPWKLHLPHPWQDAVPGYGGERGYYEPRQLELSLFNLDVDRGETRNVAADHPEIVERLLGAAEEARMDLGDSLTRRAGRGVREPGRR